ncbi:MAG: VWA domain-containing protein, partial [Chthonomonadales bacterium]
FCLNNLGPKDQFNVITFNEAPDILSKSMLSVNQESINKAQRFVAECEASGGTNIDAALQSALGMLKGADGAQRMVVFLTDGLPTVGETSVEKILQHVQGMNNPGPLASGKDNLDRGLAGARARIFCFGVGYDVNVPFLDRLAEQNRAEADYVRPSETVEAIVSTFFNKITSPVLANLNLTMDGVDTYDVFPKELPDLFKGGQMVITGRYRSAHRGSIRLTGYAQGQQSTFRLDNAFGEEAASSNMVSRIWATRKIGYLIDQVRLHSDKEVIDEIVRLSKEYGIVTPYTSYLADERQDRGVVFEQRGLSGAPAFRFSGDALSEAKKDSVRELEQLSRRRNEDVGGAATSRALNSQQYKGANQAPSQAQGGFGGGRGGGLGGGGLGGDYFERNQLSAGAGRSTFGLKFGDATAAPGMNGQASDRANYLQVRDNARVQNAGTRVFYKRGEIWFDNNYQSGQKVTQVQSLSDAHFALLKAMPELSQYSNIGDEVVILIGKSAIQIGKAGKATLTPT